MPDQDSSLAAKVAELTVEVKNLGAQSIKIETKLEAIAAQLSIVPVHSVRIDQIDKFANDLAKRVESLEQCQGQERGARSVIVWLATLLASLITGLSVWFVSNHLK